MENHVKIFNEKMNGVDENFHINNVSKSDSAFIYDIDGNGKKDYNMICQVLNFQIHQLKCSRISLKQEFGENYKLLTKKGIYPYDYFDKISKYNEKKLPNKEQFFNKINNKKISDEDYTHAKNVFEKFNCKNRLDYSILYLKTDICHLSDVF